MIVEENSPEGYWHIEWAGYGFYNVHAPGFSAMLDGENLINALMQTFGEEKAEYIMKRFGV